MASQLERISQISPVRAILAAGGLALLLLLAVAAPASAQDYPTPSTTPTSVAVTEVSRAPELPRTGSDNTEILLVVGAGVLLTGTALVVVSKRQHAKHSA